MTTDTDRIRKALFDRFNGGSKLTNTRELTDEDTVGKLPTEVLQLVGSFLSAQDLRSFVLTSKSVASDLDIRVASSALTDRVSQTKTFNPGNKPECFAVVIPTQQAKCHSISFCCKILSNISNNGDIWITEQNFPEDHQTPDCLKRRPFGNGKLIASVSTISRQCLALDFNTKAKKIYQIWVSGHEPYHTIWLENMTLARVGFGMGSTDEYRAYQFDVFAWDIFEEMDIR